MAHPTIELRPQDTRKVLELYKKYADFFDLMDEYKEYTIKYAYPDGRVSIDVCVKKKYYEFTVKPDRSILQMGEPPFHEFVVGLSIASDGGVQYYKRPSDLTAVAWLNRKHIDGGRNAESLMGLASACLILFDPFFFGLDARLYNGEYYFTVRKDFEQIAESYIQHKIIENKKKHLLDGWDVVNLTSNQYDKIIETILEHKIDFDIDKIPLQKFCLALYVHNEMNYYFFEQKGNEIIIMVTDAHTFEQNCFTIKINGMVGTDVSASIIHYENKAIEKWCDIHTDENDAESGKNWEWCANAFFVVNSFMLNFADVTMEVETKEAIAPSQSREYKRHERNSVRLFKSYKLIKGWKGKARKKAEITCLAWGVRGHLRHYKNGKVVFIEPFVKGKERDKYKGKEYALLPYKDA